MFPFTMSIPSEICMKILYKGETILFATVAPELWEK
jgi:hypothetical protein